MGSGDTDLDGELLPMRETLSVSVSSSVPVMDGDESRLKLLLILSVVLCPLVTVDELDTL